MAAKKLVVDNGASLIKIGFNDSETPRVIPNSVFKVKSERRKVFVGDQIDECKDYSGLFYVLPFQKGLLLNWTIEKQVWDYVFGKDALKVDCPETDIMITEPYFNFSSISDAMDEILFEEYDYRALCRISAAQLSAFKYVQEDPSLRLVCLVVDCGYSFTHIVPVYQGKILKEGVRRINVGGKLLTNHLKEIISYRQLHVMDETYVMNQVKEDACFVSQDFCKDVEMARVKGKENKIVRDYVLPDYTNIKRGYIKPVEDMWDKSKIIENEQIIRINIERFAVPEVLFHPSDIAISEMGIAEAIVHAIEATPKEMQPHFYTNILLTGGSCLFSGFKSRLYSDLRSLAPVELDVGIQLPSEPTTHAWHGGKLLSNSEDFTNMLITKAEYQEQGKNACRKKFGGKEK
ncbi:actin-related protein 6-like [Dendronephthya gigantea]|uniref:actin-related protein 6-like n=1 Tax=Dendronephthya gigantea TaxID=151771 RepID=UPI00106A5CB8|nr:actin-related protein 6-like [Dendronephthya gigantea]XP_028397114.1 actin-related protein 6-like [Dendronephthya gigantea]XP_028397115.1 actin-related protein 6-like [Dendronephthya gigantea]